MLVRRATSSLPPSEHHPVEDVAVHDRVAPIQPKRDPVDQWTDPSAPEMARAAMARAHSKLEYPQRDVLSHGRDLAPARLNPFNRKPGSRQHPFQAVACIAIVVMRHHMQRPALRC